MWYKKKKMWNILSAVALSISTIGFGVMVVTIDRWIDSQIEANQTEKDFYSTLVKKAEQTRNQIVLGISYKHSSNLLKAMGDFKAAKKADDQAIGIAQGSAIDTVWYIEDLQERNTLDGLNLGAEIARLSKIKRFDKIIGFQSIANSKVMELIDDIKSKLEYMKEKIRKWAKMKMIIWSCLLFIQGIGLTFGILANIFEKEQPNKKLLGYEVV